MLRGAQGWKLFDSSEVCTLPFTSDRSKVRATLNQISCCLCRTIDPGSIDRDLPAPLPALPVNESQTMGKLSRFWITLLLETIGQQEKLRHLGLKQSNWGEMGVFQDSCWSCNTKVIKPPLFFWGFHVDRPLHLPLQQWLLFLAPLRFFFSLSGLEQISVLIWLSLFLPLASNTFWIEREMGAHKLALHENDFPMSSCLSVWSAPMPPA